MKVESPDLLSGRPARLRSEAASTIEQTLIRVLVNALTWVTSRASSLFRRAGLTYRAPLPAVLALSLASFKFTYRILNLHYIELKRYIGQILFLRDMLEQPLMIAH